MLDLIVIIPVYNESKIIKKVVDEWSRNLSELNINYNIYVYNDGSKDSTLNELFALKETNLNLVVIDKKNSGHGPTILQGYIEASKLANWIFQVDSDDEISPSFFNKFWEAKENYDFIVGLRQNRNSPISRKIITFTSRLLVTFLYGSGVNDTNVPYRLMRNEKFKGFFPTLKPNTFAPNVILSGIASKNKMRIKEIFVEYRYRQTGEVSIKKFKLFKSAVKSFLQVIIYRFSK